MEVAACCKMLSFENLVISSAHISITDTGFSGLQVLRCVVINFDSVLKTVLNQCHLQVIFIHVLIKFYAVLEECMSVEENLRKILMMLEEQEQQSLQVKPLIYFI